MSDVICDFTHRESKIYAKKNLSTFFILVSFAAFSVKIELSNLEGIVPTNPIVPAMDIYTSFGDML